MYDCQGAMSTELSERPGSDTSWWAQTDGKRSTLKKGKDDSQVVQTCQRNKRPRAYLTYTYERTCNCFFTSGAAWRFMRECSSWAIRGWLNFWRIRFFISPRLSLGAAEYGLSGIQGSKGGESTLQNVPCWSTNLSNSREFTNHPLEQRESHLGNILGRGWIFVPRVSFHNLQQTNMTNGTSQFSRALLLLIWCHPEKRLSAWEFMPLFKRCFYFFMQPNLFPRFCLSTTSTLSSKNFQISSFHSCSVETVSETDYSNDTSQQQ